MARLLFLAHRLPYPPNKGDKIRSWNILKFLAARHEVHVGSFVDDPADRKHAEAVERVAASSYLPDLDPRLSRIQSLGGLLTGSPLSVTAYRSRAMQAWVDGLIDRGAVDAVVAFSGAMARFVLPHLSKVPLIMDFVDVDSDKWAQYARSRTGVMAWVYAREARQLARFEAMVARRAALSSLVTDDEAALFRRVAPQASDRIVAIPNGVDFDFFNPDAALPRLEQPMKGPAAVFTGAMDYWANVDAVCWLVDAVWPHVRTAIPDARLYIVGGKPAAQVRRLDGVDGVTVTGRVADVRPYIAGAEVAVAPMRIARGVQNKVLEAMAMARPVIATAQGFEGIDATPGEDLVLADSPQDFAAAMIRYLQGRGDPQMGASARRRVLENYSWDGNLSVLETSLDAVLSDRKNHSEGGSRAA